MARPCVVCGPVGRVPVYRQCISVMREMDAAKHHRCFSATLLLMCVFLKHVARQNQSVRACEYLASTPSLPLSQRWRENKVGLYSYMNRPCYLLLLYYIIASLRLTAAAVVGENTTSLCKDVLHKILFSYMLGCLRSIQQYHVQQYIRRIIRVTTYLPVCCCCWIQNEEKSNWKNQSCWVLWSCDASVSRWVSMYSKYVYRYIYRKKAARFMTSNHLYYTQQYIDGSKGSLGRNHSLGKTCYKLAEEAEKKKASRSCRV